MTIRMGILQVDDTREELKPYFGCYPAMFSTLFQQSQLTFDFVTYPIQQGQFPSNVKECDVYLITGSRHGVYDPLTWISLLKAWILKLVASGKPLIGICFGHQIIAEALGGKVERSIKGWGVGRHEYQVIQAKSWQKPALTHLALLASHQDQVVVLPQDAEVVAGNDFCEYAILSYFDRVLTFQAHPEFTPAYSQALMELRRAQIDPARLNHSLTTLQHPLHQLAAVNWMTHFLVQVLNTANVPVSLSS